MGLDPARWLTRLALVLLGLNAIAWLALEAPRALTYRYAFDFGEGILLNQAVRLAQGQPLYGPIDQPPYLVANYPPLYPWLIARLFPVDLAPHPLAGRLLSLIGTLTILGVLAALCLRPRAVSGPAWRWLLVLGWLALFPAWRWGLVMRVDAFGIGFAVLGLALATCGRRAATIAGLLCFTAAFLCKHSLVAAPLAWALAGLLLGPPVFARRIVGVIIALGLPWIVIDAGTGGGLTRHTIIYTANEFAMRRLLAGLAEYLSLSLGLWAVAGMALMGRTRALLADPLTAPWVLYLPIATATLLTFGATGSDANYYLEPLVALLALTLLATAPRGDGEAAQAEVRWLPRGVTPHVATLVVLCAFLLASRWGRVAEFQMLANFEHSRTGGDKLVEALRAAPGPVLSEDFLFTLAAGKRPDFQPYIFRLLAQTEKWDEGPFVASLQSGHYDLLVLRTNLFEPGNLEAAGQDPLGAGHDRFSPAMEEAIRGAYTVTPQPVWANGYYYVYRPAH